MTEPTVGDTGDLQAWFERARSRCIDDLRALLSVKTSHDFAAAILRGWEVHDLEIAAALHMACVIAYARPFTTARTGDGRQIVYGDREIKRAPGFDVELHEHIKVLRRKIIGHNDYTVFPSTMLVQTLGDEQLPLQLDINVKGMMGLADRELADRYEKQCGRCAAAIKETLTADCRQLSDMAKRHPAEFDKTHNLPGASCSFTLTAENVALPKPIGPGSVVQNPQFQDGLIGYHYVTLTHTVPLVENGSLLVTVDGVPAEFIFTVGADADGKG